MRQIGAALGRDITYVEVTHAEAVARLEPTMGEYAAWYIDGVALMAQHPQQAVQTVREITGRPGTTFAEWAAANAAMFR